jgi:hypothetical protein
LPCGHGCPSGDVAENLLAIGWCQHGDVVILRGMLKQVLRIDEVFLTCPPDVGAMLASSASEHMTHMTPPQAKMKPYTDPAYPPLVSGPAKYVRRPAQVPMSVHEKPIMDMNPNRRLRTCCFPIRARSARSAS